MKRINLTTLDLANINGIVPKILNETGDDGKKTKDLSYISEVIITQEDDGKKYVRCRLKDKDNAKMSKITPRIEL